MEPKKLSHLDDQGKARMVDVSEKADTHRVAIARGEVQLSAATVELIRQGLMKKGDVLTVAQLAGIMGGKKTSELIPLCHPLPLNEISVNLRIDDSLPGIQIESLARTYGKTGVEMEALTAVSVAALAVYDMVKAVERTARITNIRLVEKHGGRSGDIVNE